MTTPEARARQDIDAQLVAAGWVLQDMSALNVHAARGTAIREFPLRPGHGFADYLLYVDGRAIGVVEAKRAGTPLTEFELQSEKYGNGVPAGVPAPIRPLPFLYQSTGVETRFTSRLDPVPKSREVFTFHRPETLAEWLAAEPLWLPQRGGRPHPLSEHPSSLRGRLTAMPVVEAGEMWPAQLRAVRNLEVSLSKNRPRALVQMATGSGKTYTAVASIYRLIKFGQASRVLFLVDRANLAKQALKEFQSYRTPDDGRLFTELYNVQRLTHNKIDPVAKVVIGTVQRLYSMLKGEEDLSEEGDEAGADEVAVALGGMDALRKEPLPVVYNPGIPIETFDIVFVDEAHRSIYTLWRQVVEYWDAFLIGLTATPSKLTYGFFNGNVVAEYGHDEAVADGVNVDFDVYRIRTKITEQGSTLEAGQWVDKRDRETRAKRWEKLDEELTYGGASLDRDVVAPDQIRTVVRAFRDNFLKDVFGDRAHIPKTLVFAKDDSHADDLVQIIRDELGLGNDAVQKITYRTSTARIVEVVKNPDGTEFERVTWKSSGVKPDDLLQSFRNSFNPRIAVTVDMIATGTDVKPLEVLWFMRTVKSRTLFEQMKGRGVRVIKSDDFQAVTPDAPSKTRFVIVDCVGVTEEDLSDSRPLDRQPTVSLEKLLRAIAMGNAEPDVASSVASRLTRLDRQLGKAERESVKDAAGGLSLGDLTRAIVDALDPDQAVKLARREEGLRGNAEPSAKAVDAARAELIRGAVAPLATGPRLRARILDLKRSKEQVIDIASKDKLIGAGVSAEARERAKSLTTTFEQFIAEHRDEFVALKLLYGRAKGRRLTREALQELTETLARNKPPLALEALWSAYALLDQSRVRGKPARVLTDIVSLVRFATHREDSLAPFPDVARTRFAAWLAKIESGGRRFNSEQQAWLTEIVDHLAANVEIDVDDFEYAPFAQRGGLGAAHRVFGESLRDVLNEVTGVVAA